MAASQFAFKTASETAAALASKAVSAVELTQATIDRIEKYDAQINAVCVRDFDRRTGRGPRGRRRNRTR